jgi:copper chaperone CopZ
MKCALAAFALACAACQSGDVQPAPAAAPAPAPAVIEAVAPARADRPASLQHVTIKAIGMNCPESCPIAVRSALASVPGVYELGFDLDHEAVYMSYDSALGPPKEATKPMIAAIRSVGFDPWLAKESWPADAVVQVVAKPAPKT